MARKYTHVATILGNEKANIVKEALSQRFTKEVDMFATHIYGNVTDENSQADYAIKINLSTTSYSAKEVTAWINGFLWSKFGE